MGLDEILEGTALDWAACSGGRGHDGKFPNAQTEAVDQRHFKEILQSLTIYLLPYMFILL